MVQSKSVNDVAFDSASSLVVWQVIFSMADEYVPDYVDKKALVER